MRSERPPEANTLLSLVVLSESIDLILFFCYVTNARSCDFKGWSLSRQASTLPRLMLLGLSQMEKYKEFNLLRDPTGP